MACMKSVVSRESSKTVCSCWVEIKKYQGMAMGFIKPLTIKLTTAEQPQLAGERTLEK